jgi:NTP pyrophosphatase (non-canonical NTP hydrolase)
MSFIESWNHVAQEVHATAKEKGWWDHDRNDGEIIALLHSELSEALEALRHGNPADVKLPNFSSVEVELADVVIRLADYGAARGYRIAEAVEAKMAFNATRTHRHGGKHF